jgi:aspartate racemase
MTAKKTVGILGGMGPEATAHFYRLLIRDTLAGRDQEHIPVVIWADPSVPDRTDAVFGRGPSPAPALLKGLRALRRAGADFAVIPCLTAHGFLDELGAAAPLPVVSLIGETKRRLRKHWPGVRRVGLLASSGTVSSGLFQRTLAAAGIETLLPGDRDQALVMEAVYGPRGIKAGFTAGRPRTLLRRAAGRLAERGAGAIIAGCSEIPLVLRPGDVDLPLLDPMALAARACILRAGGRPRSA